jgi:hypothetical protein
MSEVVFNLYKTEDGRPVEAGDLMVLHVDRQDVVAPFGWTRHAAVNASGVFFWRIAQVNEPIQFVLTSPSPEPFKVDAMALWVSYQERPSPSEEQQ